MKTTKEQEQMIELSETKNPYSSECHNRQLWSEGFRSGILHKSMQLYEIRALLQAEYDRSKVDTNASFIDRFAKVLFDAI